MPLKVNSMHESWNFPYWAGNKTRREKTLDVIHWRPISDFAFTDLKKKTQIERYEISSCIVSFYIVLLNA